MHKITTQLRTITDSYDLTPDPNECIASLPYINRWLGHTSEPYSVGVHSLHMFHAAYEHAGIREPQLLLKIFIHNFAEAYIGDIIKPIKDLCPPIRILEYNIMAKLYGQLNLNQNTTEEGAIIKQLDTNCVVTEHKHFYPSDQPCPIAGVVFDDDLNKLASYPPEFIANIMKYVYVKLTCAVNTDNQNVAKNLIELAYAQVKVMVTKC